MVAATKFKSNAKKEKKKKEPEKLEEGMTAFVRLGPSNWRKCTVKKVRPDGTYDVELSTAKGGKEKTAVEKFKSRDELRVNKPSADEDEPVDPKKMFRTGMYKDRFRDFDKEGLPTSKADGAKVELKDRKRYGKLQEEMKVAWKDHKEKKKRIVKVSAT